MTKQQQNQEQQDQQQHNQMDGQSIDAQRSDAQSITNSATAHVVLYQPEIAQNTGNIGRTCVAVGAKLWIVRPAAFRLDDKRLRRAGLDYWQHLMLEDAINWDDLKSKLMPRRFFYFSRFAKQTIWDASFAPDDVLVFGSESAGLPAAILDREDPRSLRIPMRPEVRSLNLASTAAVVLYEHQRQIDSLGNYGFQH